jgi:hypothetical protein
MSGIMLGDSCSLQHTNKFPKWFVGIPEHIFI